MDAGGFFVDGTRLGMCGCKSLPTHHGGTCCRIQRCTGMSLGDEVAGVAFSPREFFCPSLCNTRCQGGVLAELASFFMRQSMVASR